MGEMPANPIQLLGAGLVVTVCLAVSADRNGSLGLAEVPEGAMK